MTLTFKVATQIACDTASQNGDHFSEIGLKWDFKEQSYAPDTILLQGHAVPWTSR